MTDPVAGIRQTVSLKSAPSARRTLARIVDPIFAGRLTGEHVWGQFLKDYKPAPW